jgi:hypothetical protein
MGWNFKVSNRFGLTLAAMLLIGVCGVGVTRLGAQGATATILGTVTDASGAAVPDASVQVKNTATGITQSATSDPQGRFRVSEIGVGDYEVQASKMGFQTTVHKGITLAVGSQVVVDFSLAVGQQTQTVTVEGQVAEVETTNAAISTFTSEQQMRELPLNGRNFEQLILLAPGVATVTWSLNPLQGRGEQYSVAGGRPEGQAILLDDENLQSYFNNGMSSVTGSSLGVEAIGEFQTLTNAYGAQFGGNGAVINAVSKSGANTFHGSAFDFIRNSAMDDRNFFAASSSPPAYRRNQYGGSVGGPVKKDKAFFFVDYEGIRSLFEEDKVATVPNCPAACTITATNPTTATAIADTLAIYPKPTTLTAPGSSLGYAPTSGSQIDHEDYVLTRFDYNFSEKDSMFVRYYSDNASFFEPYGGASVAIGGGALPYWHEQDGSLSQFATLEERHIFSPTLVNVARMSFSRPTKKSNETSISTAADGSHPLQFFGGTGLEDGFDNIIGIPGGLGGAAAEIFFLNQNRFTWADDMLWTRGSHSIRFGASVARQQSNTWNAIGEDAQWTFAGGLTQFLSGAATEVTGVPPSPANNANRDYRETDFTPYIQDDWKVTPKLTVNMGLRWEFYTDPTEAFGNLTAVTNIYTSTGFTKVPAAFKENISLKDWDPRVGLAYDPFADHKTAIRAGFGMFHDPVTGLAYQTGYGGTAPWQTEAEIPATYPFANVSATTPTASFGWNYDQNNSTPYVIQYNFNIQRELFSNTILTVGYVGSKGIHLLTGREYNPPIPTVINGVSYYSSCSGIYGDTVCPAGTRITANPRINPNFGDLVELQPISTSSYNSLQVVLNRRFSQSVQAQVSYTYSKCLDDGAFGVGSFIGAGQTPSSIENPYNQAIDKGVCSYDIPSILRINGVYVLPFKGNRFVSGWQLSGVISAYSGFPFTISDGFDQFEAVGGVPRPNYVPNNPATAAYPACNNQPIIGKLAMYYNPNCFALEPVGTLGNIGRDTLRGPSFFDMDISLSKDTKITERLKVQFRAEFFNILNHENFALPASAVFSSTGAISPAAGTITASAQNTNPRQIQLALKFTF